MAPEPEGRRYIDQSFMRWDTNLSSLLSTGFFGSGSLFRVLQPFKPFTDAPVTEACTESYELS